MPAESLPPSTIDADIEIRRGRPTDLDDLERLEAQAFASDRLSRRSLRGLSRSPTACLLVAAADERIVGYALLLTRRDSRAARLYSIAVDRGSSGRGIGARLLAAAEAAARARGASRLRLEVRADNAAAIRFYERRGYAATGRRESYYKDGTAALRYSRRLDADPVVGDIERAFGQAA